MGRSQKENEHRLGLHPRHLERVPADLRQRMYLEAGYGERFGVSDDDLRELVAGVRSHEQLVAECDVILQPKPLHRDVAELREGQVLWGWPHCVQDEALTQLAVDRRLTAHRLRGDEPLEAGRLVQPARLPQEQRAGRLRLGAARHGAGRHHRQLRPAAAAPSSSVSGPPPVGPSRR